MGMYDTISCARNLPQLPQKLVELWEDKENIGFQTKCLNNALDVYHINTHGELLILEREIDRENSHFGDPDAENISDRLPRIAYKSKGYIPTKHNGEVVFYTDYTSSEYDISGWVEYVAKFVDGILQGEIELVAHTRPRNRTVAEQKKIEENKKYFEEKREERKQKIWSEIESLKKSIDALKLIEDNLYDKCLEDLGVEKHTDLEDRIFDFVFNDNDYFKDSILEDLQ